jgi:hypothetical protein
MEPLLVVLLGPTGSGKTALSLTLARRFSGEIVSCDSVAVYRDMEIGTAKPSPEERHAIPHHLIDVLPPDQFMTAGDYARLAREALAGIVARRHLNIVTGGTGLYLRALLEGLFAGPQRSEELRARLRSSAERHSTRPPRDASTPTTNRNSSAPLKFASPPANPLPKPGNPAAIRSPAIAFSASGSILLAPLSMPASTPVPPGCSPMASSTKLAASSPNMAMRLALSSPSAIARRVLCCAENPANRTPSPPRARPIATTLSASSPGFAANRKSAG